MSSDFSENNVTPVREEHNSGGHAGAFAVLGIGLAAALVGVGVLLVKTGHMNDQISQNQEASQQQIAKLGDATTSLLDQRLQTINDEMASQMKGAVTSSANAVRQVRVQSQKTEEELRSKLEQEQQEVTGQIADLKTATSDADSKIAAVSTDVDGVKTDVTGVKTDVSTVKSDVASTKDGLDKTSSDLKRAMGDMGVMSGLIATNSKDLQALRELGDRNYAEFDLSKSMSTKKIGDVILTLKRTDPKHNRFTVTVSADDKLVEKRDRSINEPVQMYVHNNRQPYEIVVNQVKKDEIVGYLSTPKVTLARQ
jgi:chromosome segregation ATPase